MVKHRPALRQCRKVVEDRSQAPGMGVGLGRVAARHDGVMLARLAGQQRPHADIAEPVRFFEDHVEHRVKLTGISVDDGQHLSHSRLAFQCLLLLCQQPRVLDRNHRLISEGADEFDLPVGKRLDPLARKNDSSDHLAFAE